MKRHKHLVGVAGMLAILASSASFAAEVSRTYDIYGSGFTDGLGGTPPYDPVDVNITLTFDDARSFGATSKGLIINSYHLPYDLLYEYNSPQDLITLSTFPSSYPHPPENADIGYDVKPNEYGTIIGDSTGAVPYDYGIGYSVPDNSGTSYGDVYSASIYNASSVVRVSASRLVFVTPPTVPIPSSAPLFGAGLIALGAAGYAAKRKKAAAV